MKKMKIIEKGGYSLPFSNAEYIDAPGNIVKLNDEVDTVNKLQQMNRGYRNPSSGIIVSKPLVLLHFSDLHGDVECLKRIVEFQQYYGNYIADVWNTGDTVARSFADGLDFYNQIEGANKMITIVGNHDVNCDTSITDKKQAVARIDRESAYDMIIGTNVSNWNVVQPADVAENHCTYFYKDYDKKIRIIALDRFYYNNEQYLWLIDVLNDAKDKGLAIVIASHIPFNNLKGNDYIACSFSDSLEWTFGNWEKFDEEVMNAIDNFISSGGEFICLIHGHTHNDTVSLTPNHPNLLNIGVASAGHTFNGTSEGERVNNTRSQDNFNIIAFDTHTKCIKLMKIGNRYNFEMQRKDTMCINYITKKIVYDSKRI